MGSKGNVVEGKLKQFEFLSIAWDADKNEERFWMFGGKSKWGRGLLVLEKWCQGWKVYHHTPQSMFLNPDTGKEVGSAVVFAFKNNAGDCDDAFPTSCKVSHTHKKGIATMSNLNS